MPLEIQRSVSGRFILKQMQRIVLLAAMASVLDAGCCYTSTSQFLSTSNFYLNIAAVSAKSKGDISAKISYPREYITDQETPKSTSRSFSAQKSTNPTDINTWLVTSSGPVMNATWRLFTPGNPNNKPTVLVSLADEACIEQTWCPGFDSKNVGPASTDGGSGKINLGALGEVEPGVFWPVVAAIIVTMLGMGYVAYSRNRRVPSRSGDVEAAEVAMTRGGNGAGWFGEKKPDLSATGSSNGYRTSSAAPKIKEDEKKPKSKRPQSAMEFQSPKRTYRRNSDDDSDDSDADSVDMSRVVKKVPSNKKSENKTDKKKKNKKKERPVSTLAAKTSSSQKPGDQKRKKPQQPLLTFK